MSLARGVLAAVFGAFSACAFAGIEKRDVTFGGFVDAYYGFDFNEPSGDRAFTTQGVRHNEFSINLAYVDARLESEKVRGRLALQAGSSVYANYSGERRYGTAGGAQLADLSRHIQEAYGGYRLSEGLWVDLGIFFSHIGAESFISKDNWNYTRSLAADFSPYYQAGVKLSYQWNPRWLTCLHVINGWQNTIETNGDKALGMQVAYIPSETFSVTYNNFLGREQEFRFFNNLIVKLSVLPNWSIALSSDVGFQKKPGSGSYSIWYVETLLSRLRLSDSITIGGRLEYFHDRDQVIVTTRTANGFQTAGASINVDWQPEPDFLFRNELRSLFSRDSIFSGASGTKASNIHFITSAAVSF